MKKIISLITLVALVLSLAGCGGTKKKEYDPADGNVLITEDMLDEIRMDVLGAGTDDKLSYSYESDALRAANLREYENIKEFTSITITSEDYRDDWHYCFYGKIYGKDTYNNRVSYNFRLTVLCAEDSSTESGYRIEMDGISIDI